MSDVYPLNGGSVTVITNGDDAPSFDVATGTTQIQLPGGEVEVSFGPPARPQLDTEHNGNLAEHLTDAELSTIAEKLLLGIEQDLQSRSGWVENMSNGLSLLGLEIKNPKGSAASGATPAEGVSTVDHPLLLEAVLRFQANARGELLPSDGPVKVRNDGEDNSLSARLAEALEKDLNHYLTKTAKEYYPDTDRMLLRLGFAGISFKKGYHDPIKQRPVIASIDAEDLIVSNSATVIDDAGRITHRIKMRPSIMKRMQMMGAYLDTRLPTMGLPEQKDAVGTKIDQIQGIAPATYVEPSDQDRELYECYCETEIPGFEHTLEDEKTKEKVMTGLPLPYKVTIDKDARRILEIRRNWEEDDPFCMPRNRIIAYIFIPGLGFYGIGLLNVLGNATKAVTAAWRLMIDAGMFANFPGFLYLKSLAKQLTNQFRIPPGGGMPIDTVGNDIRASVMPLPYKDPSAVFIQLIENIATTAQRVGGTAELQIGEGKQDAPVGTTLALIEQATKLMSAVHKRLHQAQGAEFDMLKALLKEDPEALWRHNKKSKVLEMLIAETGQQDAVAAQDQAEQKHRATFLLALEDCELVPRADPNTSSQTERYLKVVAMRQMAQSNQSIDLDAVDRHAFQIMGVDDGDSYFKPPPPPGQQQPSPEQITAQATADAAKARLIDSQTKAQTAVADRQFQAEELASKEKIAAQGVAKELIIHNSDQQAEREQAGVANRENAADRLHRLAVATMQRRSTEKLGALSAAQDLHGRVHDAQQGAQDRAHEAGLAGVARAHEAQEGQRNRAHELITGNLDRQHEAAQNERQRQADLAAPAGNGVAP